MQHKLCSNLVGLQFRKKKIGLADRLPIFVDSSICRFSPTASYSTKFADFPEIPDFPKK